MMNNKTKCVCGKQKYCTRQSKSNFRGDLYIYTTDHFNCGKIQKQIQDGLELVKSLKL
jgi:hypothetical protein